MALHGAEYIQCICNTQSHRLQLPWHTHTHTHTPSNTYSEQKKETERQRQTLTYEHTQLYVFYIDLFAGRWQQSLESAEERARDGTTRTETKRASDSQMKQFTTRINSVERSL